MEKKNVPKIRFPGFTEPWEQRKIGECFKERKENMPEGELISVTINEGIKKFSELGRHDNSNEDKSKYKKVCVGDIAYNSMRMWQGASGYSPYEGIVSPAYTILAPIEEVVDSKCISYLFKRQDMLRLFQVNSQGMTSDNWNLKFPILSEINIMVSSNIKEQQKITTFFSMLDNLISLHHRKLENLKKQKKGLLQKMFPEKGKKVPEIRFPEFTNDWEQRKLEEYLIVSTEKNKDNTYDKGDVLSVSGDYGIVNQIEFQGRSFAGVFVSNYGVVHTGDIVYTKSPLKCNPYGIIKTNKGKVGIVSTLYAVYHPKKNIFSNFVQTYFELHTRMNNYMNPLVNKGAKNDMKVSSQNALKGNVIFPSYEEQKTISEFFTNLDNLISLHQRKLEHLQKQKKALLQQMFV